MQISRFLLLFLIIHLSKASAKTQVDFGNECAFENTQTQDSGAYSEQQQVIDFLFQGQWQTPYLRVGYIYKNEWSDPSYTWREFIKKPNDVEHDPYSVTNSKRSHTIRSDFFVSSSILFGANLEISRRLMGSQLFHEPKEFEPAKKLLTQKEHSVLPWIGKNIEDFYLGFYGFHKIFEDQIFEEDSWQTNNGSGIFLLQQSESEIRFAMNLESFNLKQDHQKILNRSIAFFASYDISILQIFMHCKYTNQDYRRSILWETYLSKNVNDDYKFGGILGVFDNMNYNSSVQHTTFHVGVFVGTKNLFRLSEKILPRFGPWTL